MKLRRFFETASLKTQLIAGSAAILIVAMLSLSGILIYAISQHLRDALRDKAEVLNQTFAVITAQAIAENSYSNLQQMVEDTTQANREIQTFVIVNADGLVMATSEPDRFPQFSPFELTPVKNALRDHQNALQWNHASETLESIHLLREADQSVSGCVYLTFTTQYLQIKLKASLINSILLSLLLTGLALILAYYFGNRTSRPIIALANDVRQIASGHFENTIQSRSRRDEIGQLIGDVEQMRHAIKDLTENLEHKVETRTLELSAAYAKIQSLNERLKNENLRMTAELDVARRLQEVVLPSVNELQSIPTLRISGSIRPADEVGGDYYDVLQYRDACYIGIGDVTGHGLESGLIMLMMQTAVRTLVVHGEADPVRFLNTINRTIYDNVQRMRLDRNLTFCLLEYRQGMFSLFGQHEEVLVVRRNGEIEPISTQDLGFPIGMIEDIGAFINTTTIALQPGDGIVLYTDGVVEAENANHAFYGLERLCALIQANWEHDPETVKQAVIDDVMRHIGTYIVYDDITVVVIKQKEAASA